MDITILAAWGEFIGGIAVVISLVYLASQIRMNTKTVRASNFGDLLTESSAQGVMTLDPEIASLRLRGMDDFTGLSAEDRLRFDGIMIPLVNSIYRAWNLHQQGLLDDSMWENYEASIPTLLESAGVRQWWDTAKDWYSADFREVCWKMPR
jgi:hypothetical protein